MRTESSVSCSLMLCFRYLQENMDWLEEELGGYEDDYLIFDCPGNSRSML